MPKGEHREPYFVPDYRVFDVEKCPEMLSVYDRLKAQNLCDPWLRNQVWRYNPEHYGTWGSRIVKLVGRGIPQAIVALVVTLIADSIFGKKFEYIRPSTEDKILGDGDGDKACGPDRHTKPSEEKEVRRK